MDMSRRRSDQGWRAAALAAALFAITLNFLQPLAHAALMRSGAPAKLIQRAADIDWDWLGAPSTVGITAGASAPEVLVREVVDALAERFEVVEDIAEHEPERMTFKLPRELVA